MVARPTVWEEVAALLEGVSALPEDYEALQALARSLPPETGAMLEGFVSPKFMKMSLAGLKIFSLAFSDILQKRAEGKKVVFRAFNFPPEMLLALDVAPMCTEAAGIVPMLAIGGDRFFDAAIEAGLPDTLCSGHRPTVGMILDGRELKPDIIINAGVGSCDPNAKIHEWMAKEWGIPLLNLDAPYYHDERALAYYQIEFRKLVSRLEEITGQKLDYDRLRETVEYSNQATELYLEIHELKRAVPFPVPNIYTVLVQLAKLIWAGRPETVDFFQIVRDTAKELVEKGEGAFPNQRVRALWTYSGIYYDMEIWRWLEKIGVAYLQDVFSWFPEKLIDTSTIDTMLDGLGERTFNMPMTKQMKGGWDTPGGWADDMIFLARELEADCAIFSGHLACRHAWGNFRLLRDKLRDELGIPTLRLEADILDRRVTPVSVLKEQIEEFVSTIA
ncbi:MAG: 2-hydroxyacyl-CoA dehydratase family protein [Dehalococcoidia bacterium]